jgi:hypothetical protein
MFLIAIRVIMLLTIPRASTASQYVKPMIGPGSTSIVKYRVPIVMPSMTMSTPLAINTIDTKYDGLLHDTAKAPAKRIRGPQYIW